MRFLVIVKGNEKYEAGAMPTRQELAEMDKFNDELVKAGIMLAGEGLHPSSKAVRISDPGATRPRRAGARDCARRARPCGSVTRGASARCGRGSTRRPRNWCPASGSGR